MPLQHTSYTCIPSGYLTENDLGKVMKACIKVCTSWEYIGIELGLTPGKLDAIKKDNPDSSKDCLKCMLSVWLKSANPRPSWEALADALKSSLVGEERLSEEVKVKYCQERKGMVDHVNSTPGPSAPGAPPTSQGKCTLIVTCTVDSI